MARRLRKLGGKSRAKNRRNERRTRAKLQLQLEPLEHRLMLDGSDIIDSSVPKLNEKVNINVSSQHSDLKQVSLASGTKTFFIGPHTGGTQQDVDFWKVYLTKGQTLEVKVTGYNHSSAGKVNPELRLFNRYGTPLSGNEGANGSKDPHLRYRATSEGWHYLGISGDDNNFYDPNEAGSGRNGSTGAYRVYAKRYDGTSTGTGGLTARMSYTEHSATDAKIDLSATGTDGELSYVKTELFRGTNASPKSTLIKSDTDYSGSSATNRITVYGQEPGDYFVRTVAKETSGDEEYGPGALFNRITVVDDDTWGPEITLKGVGGKDDNYPHTDPYLSWSISDAKYINSKFIINSGIYSRTVEVYRPGEILDPVYTNTTHNSGTVNLAQYGPGTYTIRAKAVDNDRDRGSADREETDWVKTKTVTFKDDDSGAPVIGLGGSEGTQSHGDSPFFSWTVTDRVVSGETSSGINRVNAYVYQDNVLKRTFNDYPTGEGPHSYTLDLTNLGLTPLGNFRIEVYAEDKDNDGWLGDQLSATAEREVTLTNVAPVADAALNQTAMEGVGVRFDARGSTDGDNDTLTYSWDFGDGSTGSGVQPLHAYDDNGSYQATVTASDGLGGASTDSVTITVVNADPTISSVVNSGPVSAGAPVTVTVSATDAAGDDPLTYEFDFDNDGIFEISNTTGVASHTYTADNVYPVNVRVSDDDGGSDFGWSAVQVGAATSTAATVQFTSSSTSTAESGVVSIQATLSESVAASVLVPLGLSGTASSDGDYALPYSYVLFPPNTTSANVTLDVLEDASDEYDESIILQILTPINAALGSVTEHIATITDDDLPPAVMFTAATATAREDQGSIVITARVDEVSGKDITIPLEFAGTATNGSDFLPPSGGMVLAAGQESVSREIAILDDSVGETNETILVSMGVVVNASPSTAAGTTSVQTITIPENDEPSISFQSVFQSVDEEGGQLQIHARLSSPWPYSAISVPVSFSGTATAGSDYTIDSPTNGLLTFPKNSTTATVSLRMTNDSLQEAAETVEVRLGTPTRGRLGATASHLVEIAASDTPTVNFVSDKSTHWEDAGYVSIPLRLSAPAGVTVTVPVDVYASTASGDEFTFTESTATFSTGSQDATVTIRLLDDGTNEGFETVGLKINPTENANRGDVPYHTLEIKDNDPYVYFTNTSATSKESSGPVDVVARLSAPSNRDVTVQFETTGTAIDDDKPVAWYLPQQGDYTATATSVTIPGNLGKTDAVLRIDPIEDNLDEPTEWVYVNIDSVSNAQLRDAIGSQVIIRDINQAPTVNFLDFNTSKHWEGNRVELVVEVSPISLQDVIVPISLSGATGKDYKINTKNLTIPAGQSTGKFVLNLVDDEEREACEKISISMGTPTHALKGQYSEATVGINDDDIDPTAVVGGIATFSCSSGLDDPQPTATPSTGGTASSQNVPSYEPNVNNTINLGLQATSGHITGGIAFFDANKNGIRDFLDFNLDGVHDPNEPLEPVGGTAQNGFFQLEIPRAFDLNDDGRLTVNEGQFAVAGGIDTSTGLPLESTLLAPIGFRQITPLSTLAAKLVNTGQFTPNEASVRVQEAFGLPPAALHATDMPAAVMAGDQVAPLVYREQVKTVNSVAQITSLVANVPNSPPYSVVADAVADDMAQKMAASGSALDLSQPLVVEAVISGVLGRFGLSLPSDKVQGAAQVVVAGNQTLDGVADQAEESFLEALARVKVVAQGIAADALGKVAAGAATIADVVAENTGTVLQDNVDAATVGNVLPVIIESSNPRVVESNTGQTMLAFEVGLSRTPAWPVDVDFETIDSTATMADSDYVFTNGSLHWAVGDTTLRTIQVPIVGDDAFEADEQFYVRFDNPQNAMLQSLFARGQIINDDLLEFTATDDAGPNSLELRVYGSTFKLFENDTYVVGGTMSEPVPITLTGAAGVANHLTIEYLSPSSVLDGGVQFVGGTTNEDRLTILNHAAQTVSHHVGGPGAGTFGVDGDAISYSDVEVVEDQHAPTLTGAPFTHPEGSAISMSVQGSDPNAPYTMDWTVIRDGETFASGAGTPFAFTPDDDGEYLVTVTSTAPGRTPASASQWIQVQNVSPTIVASGAASVAEGGVFVLNLGTVTDPGDDTVTQYLVNWGDGSVDTYAAAGEVTHVYADNNFSPASVRVSLVDEDGTHFDAGDHLATVSNATPTIEIGSDQTILEGETISLLSADFNDMGTLDTHTATIDWGDGTVVAGQVNESPFGPAGSTAGADGTVSGDHAYADNGDYTVTVTVRDDEGAEASDTFTVTVNNVAPEDVTIDMVGDNQGVFPIGPVSFSGGFTDDGLGDTHTAVWTLSHAKDETVVEQQISGSIAQASGGGALVKADNTFDFGDTANFSNLGPGVYTLSLTVTDDDGQQTTSANTLFVVYDASEGFVTGGGWFHSPEGAYRSDLTLTGKASFGFVSKYKKGATTPTGQTQFKFKAGELQFESTSYEWLVIAGSQAKYKGVGTINGTGNFGFLLTAVDGQHSGKEGADKFRLKIWDRDNAEAIVYDNQVSDDLSDDAAPTTVLGGGSIVIHDKPQALHGDSYVPGQPSGATSAGSRDLAEAFEHAVSAWRDAGFDDHELSQLRSLHLQWTDLSGSLLGMASNTNHVWIDRDAAGHGWALQPNQPGVDLISVLTHELGHVLGLGHDASEHDVMRDILHGSRSQPAPSSLELDRLAFASDRPDPLVSAFSKIDLDDFEAPNVAMPVALAASGFESVLSDDILLREKWLRELDQLFDESPDDDWWSDVLADDSSASLP